MQEYYFLFALALIYTLFATLQDLKSREVANWLNFSFIAFALSYRTFYSLTTNNPQFLILGLLGFIIFFILANALYYGNAFAGGDAKLLMAFGIILPYTSYLSLLYLSGIFIFALLLVGGIYTIIISFFVALKNKKKFKNSFKGFYKEYKLITLLSTIIFIFLLIYSRLQLPFILLSLFFLIPLIYIYTKAIDKCMIILQKPTKLTEGDWILNNIKINSKITIKKTVHGLTLKDIEILKKHNKSILIKQGIPFIPAFLITLIIMVFFFSVSKLPDFLLPFLS